LTPRELLDLWEEATAATPLTRPLVLLARAEGLVSTEELASASLGWRDARLLDLFEELAGPRVEATAACPSCGEAVELDFDIGNVRVGDAEVPGSGVTVTEGDYEVRCRPPTTRDLAAAAVAVDPEAALLEGCVVSATRGGEPVVAADLPPSVVATVEAALEGADPQAEVLLDLCCPACATSWAAPFDVASFVWEELDSRAVRTLVEVDLLARAYGWREPDVLALSPWRRRRYLDLVLG
jgi:hypothetical protein